MTTKAERRAKKRWKRLHQAFKKVSNRLRDIGPVGRMTWERQANELSEMECSFFKIRTQPVPPIQVNYFAEHGEPTGIHKLLGVKESEVLLVPCYDEEA